MADAHGRALARPLEAAMDSPSFDNSAMDGYAVGNESGPWTLVGASPAGSGKRSIRAGEAIRIFTGAPVPDGTWGVAAQEDVDVEEGRVRSAPVPAGQHVRRHGEEFCVGAMLAPVGARVGPPLTSLAASQGLATLPVRCRGDAMLVSTGSELVPTGSPLAIGQIYDSNGELLEAMLHPLASRVVRRRVPDEPNQVRGAMAEGLDGFPLTVTIGGVSVGDHDLAPRTARELGVDLLVHGVAIKPGKPFAFGVRGASVWFGLPGNPLSALVTATLFLLPWLGEDADFVPTASASAFKGNRREQFLPAFEIGGRVEAIDFPGSHSLAVAARANGLVRVPAETDIQAGERVGFRRFPWN